MGDNTILTVRSLTRADEPHWNPLWSAHLAFCERDVGEAVYAAADRKRWPTPYWLSQGCNATARKTYDRIGVATPFIKYQRGEIR